MSWNDQDAAGEVGRALVAISHADPQAIESPGKPLIVQAETLRNY